MAEERVLVVEDEPMVAEVVERYLRRDGYTVSVIHDGAKAMDAFERFQPDLIVLDLMLPGLHGTGESNPALAEGGVIGAHAGVQGGTDLTTADHGWTDPVARITVTVDASGLPSTGSPPLENGSAITWTLYRAIGGAMLLAAASVVFATSRRTTVR